MFRTNVYNEFLSSAILYAAILLAHGTGDLFFPGSLWCCTFSTTQAPEILCWRSRAFLRQGKMVRSRFELEYELALVDAVGAEHSVDGV